MHTSSLIGLLLPIVAMVCVFTFVAIAAWSDNRRKERESYYRHETYRKLMEQQGGSSQAVLELMREEEGNRDRRRLEGLRLGGLVTFVSGVGAMIFLYMLIEDAPIYLAALVPLLIGIVLTMYSFMTRPPAQPS